MYQPPGVRAVEPAAESRPRSRVGAVRVALGSALRSAWAPALLIALASGCWLLMVLRSGHDVRDFIVIGRTFVTQSHASAVIKLDPRYHYPPGGSGYDGQFAYYIALDPLNARYYLDTRSKGSAGADYRYTRILYPMLARALALGQPDAIPYTLLLINWLALAGGTLAVAAWLKRRRLSPWFALVYGLYPGLFVALQRDLNEALAYALIALGMYLLDLAGRRGLVVSALAFALASLTRETTLVFPLLLGLAFLVSRRRATAGRPVPVSRGVAASFLGVALLPVIAWKLVLWAWLGTIGRSGGVYPQPIPFHGLLDRWPWGSGTLEQAVAVALPALLCGAVSLWSLRRRPLAAELWILLANVLLLVVFLNDKSYVEYYASGRVAAGVVLAALYCLPLSSGRGRWWFWLSSVFWLLLLPALVPFPRRDLRWTDVPIALALVLAIWLLTRLTGPRPARSAHPHLAGNRV